MLGRSAYRKRRSRILRASGYRAVGVSVSGLGQRIEVLCRLFTDTRVGRLVRLITAFGNGKIDRALKVRGCWCWCWSGAEADRDEA